MQLSGKVALVTGSTSGIGLAIARALAAEGASVMINGFGDAREIAAICDELGAIHCGADLADPRAIEQMIELCTAELGAPAILVNNAGIQHVAPVTEFPPAKWDAIIAINLTAVFHTTRLALPGMRAAGWGRIINTASAHSLVASPNN
jgi:3-hydroxybutyrate dehydrogenase